MLKRMLYLIRAENRLEMGKSGQVANKCEYRLLSAFKHINKILSSNGNWVTHDQASTQHGNQ